MKYLSAIILVVVLVALPGASVFAASPTASTEVVYPSFAITSVVQNGTVTISTSNFPAGEYFVVTMGYMGTQGINGTVVATTYSDTGGTFEATYAIPAYLYGQYQIAIRMVSNSTGYYAYNWFYNGSTGGATGGAYPSTYSGIPTFSIAAVERDKNVTIHPTNFPPNDTFSVRLNWMHTQGIAGSIVQTVTTDANGTLNDLIYPVPDFLKGSYQIAVRLESATTGYYAYNWFYNNTTP